MRSHAIDAARDRVLVLAPAGRDASLICRSLNGLGVEAIEVDGLRSLADALAEGTVGTAILAEECLGSATLPELVRSIQGQPPWSDLPIVVLTRRGGFEARNARIADQLGNVTTLERPFHPTTLVGAVRATLRSRARQRSAEALLAQRDAAEAKLRRLNEELEHRVEERTAERELALAQLHEARKLETLGQLTGGVAHDFNNLLTPIMGGLDILSRKVANDERAVRIASGAMQSAERARTLVARLLAFGRRQTLQAKPVDLEVLLGGMRELIERSIGPSIKVELDVEADLPAVMVDPHQLELGVLNLVVNGRDAMPNGGRLAITASVARDDKPDLPGAFVRLRIADTGLGMNEATLAKAVEPFFTTKGVGQGTGLGLSMVHGLAGQSGGAFKLTSEVGRGTVATLWIPVAEVAASISNEPASATPAVTGSGKILLVDDEELVRSSVADSLRDCGFEVVEAASASGALAHLRQGLRPDILVTDHLMPGMTGAALAKEVRLGIPDLPILLMTGYANLREDEKKGFEVLAKPFRNADLLSKISSMVYPVLPIGQPQVPAACLR